MTTSTTKKPSVAASAASLTALGAAITAWIVTGAKGLGLTAQEAAQVATAITAALAAMVHKEQLALAARKAAAPVKKIAPKPKPKPAPAPVPGVMYDSITPDQIPAGTTAAVAGYVDGLWPTFDSLHLRFPKAAQLLSITVKATQFATALDVEVGDATPVEAATWVAAKLVTAPDSRPVVYANLSTMPTVIAELQKAGIPRGKVRLWTAHYTGRPHTCNAALCGASFEADATQWTSLYDGRNVDCSQTVPGFWT